MKGEKVGTCPLCGSENLSEVFEILVKYPILTWYENTEKPQNYGQAHLIDGSEEPFEWAYFCDDCGHEFNDPVFKYGD